ncbi:hypothetical protein GCM10017624_28460 [Azotobacter vinelandii]|nr:hypothetical protein GCM10017624_28460 [Azotobacter vinelandii]
MGLDLLETLDQQFQLTGKGFQVVVFHGASFSLRMNGVRDSGGAPMVLVRPPVLGYAITF